MGKSRTDYFKYNDSRGARLGKKSKKDNFPSTKNKKPRGGSKNTKMDLMDLE